MSAPQADRPAFYALTPGGWRDYWSLLHPPYTLWHLSYVAIGAALADQAACRVVARDDRGVLPGDGDRGARVGRASRQAAADPHPRRVAVGSGGAGLGRCRRVGHPRGLRGFAMDLGLHRRRGVPGRGLQPRAVRRRGALRRVVRAGLGSVPGVDGLLRPDRRVERRLRARRRRACATVSASQRALLDTGPRAPPSCQRRWKARSP